MSKVLGIDFSDLASNELVKTVASECAPVNGGPRLIVTANVDHVVHLRNSTIFRAAYDYAWARTADGFPIYVYARIRGARVPARVAGSDLFARLMYELDPATHRCFFLANEEATGEGLRSWLQARGFPASAIEIAVPPFGFEKDEQYSRSLATRVRQHGTTHLFIGLGAPKSEIWSFSNRHHLGDCYVLCAGAGLEYFLGLKDRAPTLLQDIGLEWFWRFLHEPRRLFRRYFIDSWAMVGAILDDLIPTPVD